MGLSIQKNNLQKYYLFLKKTKCNIIRPVSYTYNEDPSYNKKNINNSPK